MATQTATVVAITGQSEDDVVAMLKQFGGDVESATNALLDSAFPYRARHHRANSRGHKLTTPILPGTCEYNYSTIRPGDAGGFVDADPLPAASPPPPPPPPPLPTVNKFEDVVSKGKKKKEVSAYS